VKVTAEAATGMRLVDRDHMPVQEDVELGSVAGVAGPGLGVFLGLDAGINGSGIALGPLGNTPGGTSLGAVAVGHGVA
jgi:hypothetical protein